MPGFAIDSRPTIQVFSPTLAEEAELVTFTSTPSGSTLIRTIPQPAFDKDQGKPLLDSLSDAVESILGEGIATSASGSQGVDDSGLIYDAVTFTVEYVPTTPIPGRIVGTVQIPVTTLTLDTSFGAGGAQFGLGTGIATAPELIQAEYDRLKALTGA